MYSVLIALLALVAEGVPADAGLCPGALTTKQEAMSVPGGFTATVDLKPSPFMGLTFFDGDPKGEASLAPDEEKHVGDTIVSTWAFPPGNSRGNYLQCAYFGTSVALQRKLDPMISKCVVTYDTHEEIGGLPFIRRIECK
jgi:hypothetical protein